MTDLRGIVYREFRLYVRQPFNALLSFLTPLLYYFLFGMSMSASGLIAGEEYLSFFLPGYAVMSVFSAASSVVQGIFNERMSGMLSELLSYPVRISAYIIAKLLFSAVVATGQTVILLAVALVVGPVQSVSLVPVLHVVLLLFMASLVISSLVACIMAVTVTIRSFITIVNIVNPVLMFASSIFYPLDRLPAWVRLVATVNPLTWSVESIRGALHRNFDQTNLALLVGGSALLLTVAVIANTARIRRA